MKLIRADYMAIAAFLLIITAQITTNIVITYYKNIAKEIKVAEKVVNNFEANPVTKLIFDYERYKLLFSTIFVPIWFFGIYYYIRRKYINLNLELLESIAFMILLMAFLDASNDISILLGLWIK